MDKGYEGYNQSNTQIPQFSKYNALLNAAAKNVIKHDDLRRATEFIFRNYLSDQRSFCITVPLRVFEKWLHSDTPLSPNVLPDNFENWLKTKTGKHSSSAEAKFNNLLANNHRFRQAFIHAFWTFIFREYHPYPVDANRPNQKKGHLRNHMTIRLYEPAVDPSSLGSFEVFLDESTPDEELFIMPGNEEEEVAIQESSEIDIVPALDDGIKQEPESEITPENSADKQRKKRTMYEVQKESVEKGFGMILERVKFVSTDLDTAVMRIISDYTKNRGKLELPLTIEEYQTVSIQAKGLYPNFIPDSLLDFLYESEYYLAKETVDLVKSEPDSELVRLFKYYFWKTALGHSKQHSEKLMPFIRVKNIPQALSGNFIGRDEYRTIIGRFTGGQNDRQEDKVVKKTDRRLYVNHQMSNEILDLALDNNPLGKYYFHEIVDLFLGDFTLYLSKNLYMHISRGDMPNPDYIVPRQIVEFMIRLRVIKDAGDLRRYGSESRAKAFGFMYIFWLIVRKISPESGAIVIYENKHTAASKMTGGVGFQYADQDNIPSDYIHEEVPGRIREELLRLSLQHALALTLFRDQVEIDENKESEVEQ
jgi:hypothetical protein